MRSLLIAGTLVIAVGAFTVYQAIQARDALSSANKNFDDLTSAVAAGDSTAAQASLYAAQKATLSAQRNTGGPVWWLASKAPIVGDDVTAVRTATDVVDQVAQGVLPTLVDASTSLSSSGLQPKNGVIKLDDIERLAPALDDAHIALRRDLTQIEALQPETLVSAIASPVEELETKLTKADSVTATASTAAKLLPPMLGAEGPRTYLVLFQNNAEIRATGGIPGAVATITADHGVITLQQQGSASALGDYKRTVLPLTRDEKALFTSKLGVFPADVTFTPDFSRTARLAGAMWLRATGRSVDGVVSTDPVALSYLLAGTGPVTLGDGQQLTADNAIQLLLNAVYLDQPDTARQDSFFADAARRVFEGVVSGQGNASGILAAIRRGAVEDRIQIWSSHADEEALLRKTTLAGALPTEPTAAPQIGVYLNDGTGSKMDYYLDYSVSVDSTSCSADGEQTFQVDVTMSSKAPADAATLPVSVIGPGFGVPAGWIRTNVLLYAPVGGSIATPTIDGKAMVSAPLVQYGRPVAAQTIDLPPGDSHLLSFTVTGGSDQPETPDVQVTPGLPGSGDATVSASTCQQPVP